MPTQQNQLTTGEEFKRLTVEGSDGIERVKADDYRRIYANSMQLAFSNWDMWISFGESIGEINGKPLVEEKTRVTMSHEHAKIMTALLLKHLEMFESQVGEIPLHIINKREDEEVKATEEDK